MDHPGRPHSIRARSRWLLLALLVLPACSLFAGRPQPPSPPPQAPPQRALGEFSATAYTIAGKTAVASRTRQGIVAADPAILPLGSRIRVLDAGGYSGEYLVSDTGRKINGREIDIYIANDAEAKRFGKRKVQV